MALAATHAAGQYHMDIKPNNILIDDENNAVIIDWEQMGASPFFLAPEANGEWDVEETVAVAPLRYNKHSGPQRENHWSFSKYNVFPIWQKRCPRALQAARVYSLGRTLWVIFE